jgi:hypothetical protein
MAMKPSASGATAATEQLAMPSNFSDLRAGLRGPLLLPGEPGFDEARRVFNGLIDRRPAAIAQCSGTADVVHAVNFGRTQGIRVSVRGGGHNVAGLAVCEGGLVIDLSRMRSVRVDPTGRRVWVQGGATWAEVDRETQLFGLATPGGLVSSTGVAGFTLGGGIGWLAREHGLASDNLVGAEVVLANGSVRTASATENADLFWALRGGGGNFGVVTSFEYQLHEVGPVVYGGALFYRRDHAVELLEKYARFASTAPEKLTTLVVLLTGPPAPFLPPDTHGKPMIAFAGCYDGSAAKGEAALRPLREALGTPVADLFGPIPYTSLQSMFDASAPPGRLHYWKSHHLRELNGATAAALVRMANSAPSLFAEMHLHQLGGRSARPPEGGSAYSSRGAPFILNLIGQWTQPNETETNIQWVRDGWEGLRPHATGDVYVNFLAETDVRSVKASYGTEQFRRLEALKAKYDPENLFRANHNVPPSGGTPARAK